MNSPSHTGPSVISCSSAGFVSNSNFQDMRFLSPCVFTVQSVRFFDEDERRALHDRRARPDKGNVRIFYLTLAGASGRLQHAFDDMPEPVDAPRAETAAESVE